MWPGHWQIQQRMFGELIDRVEGYVKVWRWIVAQH